jgi:hypothetical protein
MEKVADTASSVHHPLDSIADILAPFEFSPATPAATHDPPNEVAVPLAPDPAMKYSTKTTRPGGRFDIR